MEMRYGPFFKPKTVQVYSTLKICTLGFFLNELPYITKTPPNHPPAHTPTPWEYVLFVHTARKIAQFHSNIIQEVLKTILFPLKLLFSLKKTSAGYFLVLGVAP